ncbi:Periplasmic chaperone PpiD OS=Castellaniella defragrans (strain DSM / CCUG 39792 / 65Phen) OX=1437824 GN=BN940_08816 PE=3 SV=1 [Castellaniella denitrificans]|uniref:SurA N-terminal domain-containing protein n=1 Tax=Castellaniella sp. TaxID=1955812 RepID=UPI002AFFA42F|nr:SurA N-terminal domain-containing protein [Castellaniella sp.]
MFDFIRTHQRLMQLILLILVVPSFVFLGISGYSFVTADPALVEIGRASVTRDEFVQAQRNQLQQMQESSQGRFDPALLDNPQARQALLDQLVDRKLQIAVATRDHFSVSDGALRRAIAAMPQLQVDGQFSPDRYHEVLTSYGLTPHDFEAGQRSELALDRVLGPVRDTAGLPAPVLDGLKRALTEERTIRLRVFKAEDHVKGVQVSDQDIQAWYDGHQDALRLPEQVSADYLVLDEAAAMASVPAIEEAQLKDYYEQNKARYVVPARVSVSHILVKLPAGASDDVAKTALAKAEGIVTRARAEPSGFADLARKESQDAGTARDGGRLGWIQRGTLPLAMEQAVFALKQGEVSDPVKGPDGYHVFMADQVQPEQGESFEQARAKVEDEVRRQLAADRFADMATKLTGLVYDNPSSLDPAAKDLGLQVRQAGGIARDRLLSADEAGPGAASASGDSAILGDVRVRQALFSSQVLTDKQNSGVIEISPDTMVVVRARDVTPAHVPPLEQVRDHIRAQLTDERALAAAVAEGEKALAGLKAQPSAEGFGEPATVSRLDPAGLSKSVLDAAFAVEADKTLPAFGGVALPRAYAIVQVDKVQPGTTDAPALDGLGQQMARVWGGVEQQAVLAELRQQLGVKITDGGRKLVQQGDGGSN